MKTLTPTRFQYNLSLLNGGSTTVRVEQKVNGVYQYLATQQTQTTSGTYELSFVPSFADIRISVSGTSRYALNNLYLDRDQVDTLVASYVMGRSYRYGFQGQEKDDEVKGAGNSVNYTYRMHDPRLGRFFAVDPLASDYPWNSPYAFSENRVLDGVELEGLEVFFTAKGTFLGMYGDASNREIRVVKSQDVLTVKSALETATMYPPGSANYSKGINTAMKYTTTWGESGRSAKQAVSKSIFKIWLKSEDEGVSIESKISFTAQAWTYDYNKFGISGSSNLNNHLYNQVNVWFHEDMHSMDIKDNVHNDNDVDGGFRHFEILSAQTKHWSFKYTTDDYKDNIKKNGFDYLNQQRKSINQTKDPKLQQQLYEKYKANKAEYKKTFNMSEEDYEK